MTPDKARALGCAGIFCLAVALGGGSRAAQVYPGCAEPGPIGKVWYVDPVNGKTPADGGDGSRTAPWNSLSGVVSSTRQPGYSRPMLSTVAYDHYPQKNAQGARIYADGPNGDPARVQPGDEVLLMSGQYGDISIGTYAVPTTNSGFVTIAAAPGQTPTLASLTLTATNMWRFQHLSVQSIGKSRAIVVADQGSSLPTSDIIFESIAVGSPEPVDGWTQADWIANAHYGGFSALSSADGLNTKCTSFTGGAIYGVRFGATLFAHHSVFSNNTIDHFGDDAVDYAANGLIISDNYVHDNLDVGDGNHEDCMQGFIGPLNKTTAPKNANGVPYTLFSDVAIERNRCIRQTDPNLKFATYLQGIDAFDSDWTNLTVVNNVVVTSACWGIGYASVHGGKIINNTVLDDGLISMPGNCKPNVSIGDKTHQGLPSNDVIVRNNIANGFGFSNANPNVTMDHNICASVEGKCPIETNFNGNPSWDVPTRGTYGDHNVLDDRGADGMFVGFDPARFAYDLRLKPEASAIGAGNPADAPAVDITGAPRGSRIDIGAYQYRQGE